MHTTYFSIQNPQRNPRGYNETTHLASLKLRKKDISEQSEKIRAGLKVSNAIACDDKMNSAIIRPKNITKDKNITNLQPCDMPFFSKNNQTSSNIIKPVGFSFIPDSPFISKKPDARPGQ
jgi:hypothetical protein